jgi:hypothetical protein
MSSRRPSSRCDAAREPQGQWCTPMRRISMPGCPSGMTPIRPSVTPRASVPATTMALGSVRGMSTPWKAAGPCFGLGAVLTGASPKSNGRSTWASSRSFTTSGDEARRDSGHGSNSWSHSSLESGKSQRLFSLHSTIGEDHEHHNPPDTTLPEVPPISYNAIRQASNAHGITLLELH